MVRELIWSRKALADLREIYAFISRDSKRYAQAQIQRIQAAAARSQSHPKIGPRLPEFPHEDWRELRSDNYRVIYRHDEGRDRILILAVVHVRRLMDRSLVV